MKYCTVCKAKYDDSVSFCPVDGEVLDDDPSSIVGTVLDGQYQIENLLGKGGMGAVFLARHILLGDRVAIKVLPPEMRNNAEWLRRFRREGQAARRFRHPNAVTVYDLRTAADGTIYMVMEYVEGHTLDAEMKARGHFTPADAVMVMEPIMSVLNAAHSMGVVHRDLKPENIMIGKPAHGGDLNVKLLDLGIAKLREVAGAEVGANTALTMAGQMLGTPYYMSPEQWGELPRDGNEEIDGRADIYSLGLVFYEMVAGKRPYSALTLLELRKEHVSVTPRRLDEVLPAVPRGFAEVIARSMAKDRSDRPATMGELAVELKAALAGQNGSSTFVPALKDVVSSHSPAVTVATDQPRGTLSEVDAPTVIGMDASAPVTAPPAQAGAFDSSQTIANPTVVEFANDTVAITPARDTGGSPVKEDTRAISPPPPVQPPRTVAAKSGSKTPLIIGAVLLLVLAVGGVGGYFVVKSLKGSSGANTAASSSTKPATSAAAPKEVARYWLEVASAGTEKSAQVVPQIPLASGQRLKFHFTPTEDGYLYIVGPGEKNKLTAFLTAQPAPGLTGWASNAVKKGANLRFPTDGMSDKDERWLTLDTKPGAETYTMIFSPTPLESPRFLAHGETGYQLTTSEQEEFIAFLDKYRSLSKWAYNTSDPSAPYVVVTASGTPSDGNPLVIDVRIEHK